MGLGGEEGGKRLFFSGVKRRIFLDWVGRDYYSEVEIGRDFLGKI